jgi:DeoR-like helix-turn-helix domain
MITDAVRSAEQISVAELAAATGTSEMTIHRDLEFLALSRWCLTDATSGDRCERSPPPVLLAWNRGMLPGSRQRAGRPSKGLYTRRPTLVGSRLRQRLSS